MTIRNSRQTLYAAMCSQPVDSEARVPHAWCHFPLFVSLVVSHTHNTHPSVCFSSTLLVLFYVIIASHLLNQ